MVVAAVMPFSRTIVAEAVMGVECSLGPLYPLASLARIPIPLANFSWTVLGLGERRLLLYHSQIGGGGGTCGCAVTSSSGELPLSGVATTSPNGDAASGKNGLLFGKEALLSPNRGRPCLSSSEAIE